MEQNLPLPTLPVVPDLDLRRCAPQLREAGGRPSLSGFRFDHDPTGDLLARLPRRAA